MRTHERPAHARSAREPATAPAATSGGLISQRLADAPAMVAQRERLSAVLGAAVVQRFADYYAWGQANTTPHVHVYNSGMHLKSAGGHRYNVVYQGARAAAADDALQAVQGKDNRKLRRTIKDTARDTFGVAL
jgi:hypothetical protein